MTTTCHRRPRSGRSGLTLIELLIVCFIIVMFVAVAVPLMRPNTAETRIREGARQVNAFVAEAKAYAAQHGRPVALVFDRSSALNEGARDPNLVSRLYLAESPPHYSGDDLGSLVFLNNGVFPPDGPSAGPIARNPRPAPQDGWFNVTNIPTPPWYTSIPPAGATIPPATPALTEIYPPQMNGIKATWFKMNFSSAAMLEVILLSYLPQQASPPPLRFVPFRIRFSGRGSYYDAYAEISTNMSGTSFRYFCWAPYGKELAGGFVPYQIEFPPIPSGGSQLDMPTGTIVDLRFSGYGPASNNFGSASTMPLMIVFSPGGDVERIYANGTLTTHVTRMHFLVGSLERAVEDQTLFDTAADISRRTSTLNDRMSQWVSVQARSGNITTADNAGFDVDPPAATTMPVPPNNPGYGPLAITRARAMAVAFDTKGGR